MKIGELELSPAQKTLFVLAAAVVVLFGIKEASVLLTPALLALLIALAVLPAQQWLGHRIGRVPAYLVMLAAVFLAIVAATVVLALGAAGFAAQLARLTGRADDVSREALTLFAGLGLEPGRVAGAVRSGDVASPERLLAAAGSVLEAVGDFGLIVLLAVVMLADAVRLREKVDALELTKGGMVDRLECVVGDVRDYLRITAIAGVMIAVPATGLFLLLGIPLAPLWGVLLGLLKFVPVLGLWLGLIPPIALLALERGLWWGVAGLVAVFLLNQVVEHGLKTRMIGEGLNLSPFTVIFSLFFWAFILGPVGTILAVPLTLAVKELLFDAEPRLRWLSVTMSARVPKAS